MQNGGHLQSNTSISETKRRRAIKVATSRDGKLNLGLNISREITKDDIWKKG